MKALTEQEVKLLESLDVIQKEFNALSYHLKPPHGDEIREFTKRIDEAKYIIAIRGMLRNSVTEKTSPGYREIQFPTMRRLINF